MVQQSLLSDDLVRQLVAVGHVDILVGVPTLDHAASLPDLIQAVQSAFATYFPRARTLVINAEGGSSEGTATLVREIAARESAPLSASGLRTAHRISTPVQGLPGTASALRLILASADLTQAAVIAILDPHVTNIRPDRIAALVKPVASQQFDFVAPVYPREWQDGLLVTQLLRPLMRATCSWRISEPFMSEFGCSLRLAAAMVEHALWDAIPGRHGAELWLTGTALTESFRCCQVALEARLLASHPQEPTLSEVFPDIVGALFASLEKQAGHWLPRVGSQDLPTFGTLDTVRAGAPPSDLAQRAASFAQDVRDVHPVLAGILSPDTLATISAAAESHHAGLRYADELWACTVYECLLAHHRSVMRREHIARALLPLYRGRTASFLAEHVGSEAPAVEESLESLCLAFERGKSDVVERWNQTA